MSARGIRNGYGFFLCLLFICIASLSHAIVYVDGSASGAGDGSSWANAYNTIQAGVNDADSATTDIWVADGTYTESIVLTSDRKIYGGFEGYYGAEETEIAQRDFTQNITIINGNGAYRVVRMWSVVDTRMDGFIITGGSAYGSNTNLEDRGAGFNCDTANSSNIIANCFITGNQASFAGGGINCIDSSSPMIINCVIADNQATGGSEGGGGIWMGFGSSPEIVNCVFSNNYGYYGGGIKANINTAPEIINCAFSNNSAGGLLAYGGGGGIFCSSNSDPLIRNTIFEGHNKYGVYAYHDDCAPILENCLFWNNPDGAYGYYPTTTTYDDNEMDLLNANLPGAANNIYGDPVFENKSGGDFHILPCSAALDMGLSTGSTNFDLDGNPRPVDFPYVGYDGTGEGVDIGAYEIQDIPSGGDPEISVTPSLTDFGSQYVNQGPTDSRIITITNTGAGDLEFNYISLGDATNFAFATQPLTTTLSVCQNRQIEVVFDPASPAVYTTTITISTNDPITPTCQVYLTGEGLNTAPEAVVCGGGENYALDFDGDEDYVNCGNGPSLSPSSQLTVEAWINADQWEDDHWEGVIVDKHAYTTQSTGYVLRAADNGRVSFNIGLGDQGWFNALTDSLMNTGQWYHIAGTYDGSYLRIYINGILQKSAQNTTGYSYSPNNTYSVTIGDGTQYNYREFDGKIDDVRIWNVARSQIDIQDNMNKALVGNEPGLAAYWRLDEGSGTMAYDSTINANNGVLNGLPNWTTGAPDVIGYLGSITTDENTDTTAPLCGEDPDGDTLYAWITKLPEPGTGALYQFAGIGPVRGALIDTTPTLVTDPGMRVVFVPVDTPFNYMASLNWKVNDGFVDSPNEATINIRVMDNDAPELVENGPFNLAKGDTLYFTSPTLYATDFEDIPENIVYTLANPPTHGSLWLDVVELGMSDT
ncbi:choice-of-anchor D domain-containing protein, partial [Candidatus Sumerlaeota bacterium]|nr:choice-of-anchor D domain-containing protein [Candidatus Sumerlaeota bacterium]